MSYIATSVAAAIGLSYVLKLSDPYSSDFEAKTNHAIGAVHPRHTLKATYDVATLGGEDPDSRFKFNYSCGGGFLPLHNLTPFGKQNHYCYFVLDVTVIFSASNTPAKN